MTTKLLIALSFFIATNAFSCPSPDAVAHQIKGVSGKVIVLTNGRVYFNDSKIKIENYKVVKVSPAASVGGTNYKFAVQIKGNKDFTVISKLKGKEVRTHLRIPRKMTRSLGRPKKSKLESGGRIAVCSVTNARKPKKGKTGAGDR